jgi:hypothetical protein
MTELDDDTRARLALIASPQALAASGEPERAQRKLESAHRHRSRGSKRRR